MSGKVSKYREAEPYATKDGSIIRELMHPALHGNTGQSLAEATVHPGRRTEFHVHQLAEELYHVTKGTGMMHLGDDRFRVEPGDTVLIPPGTPHRIENDGADTLVFLCSCAPAYSHDDTKLMESP